MQKDWRNEIWKMIDEIVNDMAGTTELKLHAIFPSSGDLPHWECKIGDFWNEIEHWGVGGSPYMAVLGAYEEWKLRND